MFQYNKGYHHSGKETAYRIGKILMHLAEVYYPENTKKLQSKREK